MYQTDLYFMNNWWLFSLLMVWTLFWKGWSLWTAVKKEQRVWFILLLILNTFGILEIIYLFFVAKKKYTDLKKLFVVKKEIKEEPKE